MCRVSSEQLVSMEGDPVASRWVKGLKGKTSSGGRPTYPNPHVARTQGKARDKSVRLVFHGTREDNIECICREGLDPTRRGSNGQAHGPGEYFAENPSISVPYCAGGKKMIVFAVLMDKSGLTKRDASQLAARTIDQQTSLLYPATHACGPRRGRRAASSW